MDRVKFIDSIENQQNDKTIELIGKIDTEVLESNKIQSVYYSFPLIERMVLEIYKLIPESNVEYFDQGTMRTVMQMIEENNNYNDKMIIPQKTLDSIIEIFKEDGIRNKIFHVSEVNVKVEIPLIRIEKMVIIIIMSLLEVLKGLLEKYDQYRFRKIEPLI